MKQRQGQHYYCPYLAPFLGFAITNIIKIFNKCKFKGWLFCGISGEFSIFV